MADRSPFPDVEVALVDLLADIASGGSVTPPTLQTSLPYLRVKRFGGPDDGWTDSAVVSIDAFADNRDTAHTLAESVRQRLLTPGPKVTAAGSVDKATTETAPNEVPWSDDQSIHRFTATYRVTFRR